MKKILLFAALAVAFQVPFLVYLKGEGKEVGAIARFLSRHDGVLLSYVGTRHISAVYPKRNMHAEMDVEFFLQDGVFRYEVRDESGSKFIRGLMRDGLKEEQETLSNVGPAKMDFSLRNYAFTASTEDFPDVVSITTRPLRKEKFLIDGTLFLTPSGSLVRIEGHLAKPPSFWTSKVDVVRVYDTVSGFSLPVYLESSVTMRAIPGGVAYMAMSYEYKIVNGIRVERPS